MQPVTHTSASAFHPTGCPSTVKSVADGKYMTPAVNKIAANAKTANSMAGFTRRMSAVATHRITTKRKIDTR